MEAFARVALISARRHAARRRSVGRRSEAEIPNCHCLRRRPRLPRTRAAPSHDAWCVCTVIATTCLGFHPHPPCFLLDQVTQAPGKANRNQRSCHYTGPRFTFTAAVLQVENPCATACRKGLAVSAVLLISTRAGVQAYQPEQAHICSAAVPRVQDTSASDHIRIHLAVKYHGSKSGCRTKIRSCKDG